MNPLKKLASDTAVYGLSSILGRLLNYLLVPLHTVVLSRGDYGIVTELYALAAFLTIVYSFGLETSFFRFATKFKERLKSVYSTALTSVSVISLILSLGLIIFSTPIVNAMDYEGMEHFVWIFSGILFLDAVQAIPFALIRLERHTALFAKARISGILTNILMNIFFLWFCRKVSDGSLMPFLKDYVNLVYSSEYDLVYIFISNLMGSLISAIYVLPYFLKAKISIDTDLIRPMFKFGYPLVFTGLAVVTNEMLSRLALKYWLPEGFYPDFTNQEILGIFGGVYKLSILINLGNQAFRYAAEPFIFSQSQDKESPNTFALMMKYYILFGCMVWVGVTFNLPILKYFLSDPDYWTALNIVPILLLAGIFTGVNYNLSVWYKLADKTHVGTWITIFGALLTFLGNWLFIPLYGYTGSAWVSVGVFFIMAVSSYILGQRHSPYPYEKGKILLIFIVSGFCILLYFLLPMQDFTKTILLDIIGLGLLIFAVFGIRKSII